MCFFQWFHNDRRLQESLDKLFQWSLDWQMEFNVNKCKVMHLGRSNRQFKYTLNGQVLKEIEEEKDLGIMFNCSLKPSVQCLSAYNKANRILGMIKRTIRSKNKH